MREAIRQKLALVPEVGDRVYEPHAAGADTKKPYIVINQGSDNEESGWAGFRRIIDVWPNVSRTTFVTVDSLAQKIIDSLTKDPLTTSAGEVFTCIYQGVTGDDVVDAEWDIITRGLRFAVSALQPVVVDETVADDPWVEAVATWTQTLLGEDWAIYRNKWPLGYAKPSVMWRVAKTDIDGVNRAAFKVKKTLVGHVLGATPNQQAAGVVSIAEGLVSAIKVPLNLADRRYMTVDDANGDYQADALTAGQIRVELSRITMRPFEDAPLMAESRFKNKM